MTTRVGSILHGAYGDYYEQMLCLKYFKRQNPGTQIVLFFESDRRLAELRVFDMTWADEVQPLSKLHDVPVDRFLQYQIRDHELQDNVISKEREFLKGKIDFDLNLKPWTFLRTIDFRDPTNDIGLSAEGEARLPACMRDNGVDEAVLKNELTVGFLWRYRSPGNKVAISSFGVADEAEVRRSKAELITSLIRDHGAHVFICGMNVKVNEENRTRIDAKFSEKGLDVDSPRAVYLRGLSWGLELEILKRCSVCIVMPSGFSEALWFKQKVPLCLVNAPAQYLLKILYNRMPLFDLLKPREMLFQLRPHTKDRVIRYLTKRGLLQPGQRARVEVPA